MQIIQSHHYAGQALHEIAIGLMADSYSWEGWHAIHLYPAVKKEEVPLSDLDQFRIAKTLRQLLPCDEGTILCLKDGSVLAVFRHNIPGLSASLIVKELNRSLEITVPPLDYCDYALREEGQMVVDFARSFLGGISRMKEAEEPHTSDPQLLKMLVPHLGDFLTAWMTICEGREGRNVPHILVVDDDPLARRIARNALGSDYPIATAENAAEAIEKHLLLVPDIVFLDIGLPDADGFMVLNHIHAVDPQCTVVMFSGNSFLDNRVKALSSGAGGFLPKPFNKQAFDHYIEDWKTAHGV